MYLEDDTGFPIIECAFCKKCKFAWDCECNTCFPMCECGGPIDKWRVGNFDKTEFDIESVKPWKPS